MFSPTLVSASASNVERVKAWLEPLNKVSKGMASNAYGVKTIGAGGVDAPSLPSKSFPGNSYWSRPAKQAMKQQADTVFLLGLGWSRSYIYSEDYTKVRIAPRASITPEQAKKTKEMYKKAAQKLKEENEQRKKKGLPPKVINGNIVTHYFGKNKRKRGEPQFKVTGSRRYLTPKDVVDGMTILWKENATSRAEEPKSLNRKKKNKFTFNVVHFKREGDRARSPELKSVADLTRGDYSTLSGLSAIKSSSYSSTDTE